MEVQVWVAEAVENGSAGLEAETNSIKMAVQWKQKDGDGSVGVEAETVEMAVRVSKLKQER